MMGVSSVVAQVFKKGDMVADLGIGVGLADIVKATETPGGGMGSEESSMGTFNQKLSFEYGAIQVGKTTIGFGAILSNSVGFGFDSQMVGKYDYEYKVTTYRRNPNATRPSKKWKEESTYMNRRSGTATFKSRNNIDDFTVCLKSSCHVEIAKNLDTYATVGFGLSFYNYNIKPQGETGLKSLSYEFDPDYTGSFQNVFSYNDADHLEYSNGSNHTRLAMALCVGARYYIHNNLGIYGEFGLTSASFKKSCNVYNILSLGVSYKF